MGDGLLLPYQHYQALGNNWAVAAKLLLVDECWWFVCGSYYPILVGMREGFWTLLNWLFLICWFPVNGVSLNHPFKQDFPWYRFWGTRMYGTPLIGIPILSTSAAKPLCWFPLPTGTLCNSQLWVYPQEINHDLLGNPTFDIIYPLVN